MFAALLAIALGVDSMPNAAGPIFSGATTAGVAMFEFAPSNGAGLSAMCSGGAVTGSKGEATLFRRASAAECISNDGQTLTQLAAGLPRVSSGLVDSTVRGVWFERDATNIALRSRDMSDAVWVKTNMTCARTATGMRNDANGASTCTASAASGQVLQAITLAASRVNTSVYIKRRTGTGTVSITVNGGTTWNDITAGLSSSVWRRVVSRETPGCTSVAPPTNSNCIVAPGVYQNSIANPSIGLQLGTSGDAVDVDFWQSEVQGTSNTNPTTPIETAGVSASRSADTLDWATPLLSASTWCQAATVTGVWATGIKVVVLTTAQPFGDDTLSTDGWNLVTGSSLLLESRTFTPNNFGTGRAITTPTDRISFLFDGTLVTGCTSAGCTSGTPTFAPLTIPTRTRLGTQFSSGLGNQSLDGVMRDVQIDSNPGKCRVLR